MFEIVLVDAFWWSLGALVTAAALGASAHAIIHKRDSRAAIAWVGLIWLAPLAGALAYYLLGINRIQRRGRVLGASLEEAGVHPVTAGARIEALAHEHPNFPALMRLVGELSRLPLATGNRITPLVNGDAAYPEMLAAIDSARESIALCSYIFDNDRAGSAFADALVRAQARGVQVRVLIDGVGASYSHPTMVRELEARGLNVATFLPTRTPRMFHYANLRNHRKILVVDGRIGFTGGMNIRAGHWLSLSPGHPVQDIHFRVEGPVVAHLQEVFATDWAFTTGERLTDACWFPALAPVGAVPARGVPDGPDEDFESLRLVILGAIAAARDSIHIATPYFLPDSAIITALNVAAMRGVAVRILLPGQNNIVLVQWAAMAQVGQLLERGCRIWLAPPPFDHSKIFVVDGSWALVGSTNWDPRSLRLNFEFNLECYDDELAGGLARRVEERLRAAHELTLAELDARPLWVKLRDGAARLFSPYL